MPWLNLDINYFDHIKTLRLIGLLGPGAAQLPIRLWCYCAKYARKGGRLKDHSQTEIEAILGWEGEPGKCASALLATGFLEKDGDNFVAHDFKHMQGHLAAFEHRARRAAEKRWKNIKNLKVAPNLVYEKEAMLNNDTSIAQAHNEQCSLPPLPLPNQTNLTNQPTRSNIDVNFEKFWDAYPKQVGKLKARKSWSNAKKAKDFSTQAVFAALERQKKSSNWTKDNGQFVPHPTTWLNQGRWLDSPSVNAPPPPNHIVDKIED